MCLRGGQVWMQVSLWKWTGGRLRGLGAGILDGLWTWKFKSHPGVALTKVESWTWKQAPKSSVKVGEWLWGPLITDVRKVQHATASQVWERKDVVGNQQGRAKRIVSPPDLVLHRSVRVNRAHLRGTEESQSEFLPLWLFALPFLPPFYKIVSLLHHKG